jgi:hypothetical protein
MNETYNKMGTVEERLKYYKNQALTYEMLYTEQKKISNEYKKLCEEYLKIINDGEK